MSSRLLPAVLGLLLIAACGKDKTWFVGRWEGTYECDFPAWSSVKAPDRPSPVAYVFGADGTCVRSEPGADGMLRMDTLAYEVREGMMIWDGGDEASEEIDIVSDDGFTLLYDNGHGGTCRTMLVRPEPDSPSPSH